MPFLKDYRLITFKYEQQPCYRDRRKQSRVLWLGEF